VRGGTGTGPQNSAGPPPARPPAPPPSRVLGEAAYALSISKRRFRFALAGAARAAARYADRYASDRQNLLADKRETRSAPLAEMPGRDVVESTSERACAGNALARAQDKKFTGTRRAGARDARVQLAQYGLPPPPPPLHDGIFGFSFRLALGRNVLADRPAGRSSRSSGTRAQTARHCKISFLALKDHAGSSRNNVAAREMSVNFSSGEHAHS